MKLARKAIITIMTVLALLVGASAAAATTASAATTAAPSLTPNITWKYWSSYGTLHACNAEGDHLYLIGEHPDLEVRGVHRGRLLRMGALRGPGAPAGQLTGT